MKAFKKLIPLFKRSFSTAAKATECNILKILSC